MSGAKGHQLHPSIIREYDIRGVADETLHAEDVYAVGRVYASMVREAVGRQPVIATGRDGRLSSPKLHQALQRGLVDSGADVRNIGVGPTPMLYFSVYHLEADAGVMLTGSHNPPTHNGMKFMLGRDPFYGKQVRELARRAADGLWEDMAGTLREESVMQAYIETLLERFNGAPMKAAWDAGNGAAGEVVARLCAASVCDSPIALNTEIDGHFPAHHPDPSLPENLQQLSEAVTVNGCKVGLAFDGDGDRLGAVDDKGRMISPDHLLMLLAKNVLADNKGATVIADVKTSQTVFDFIEQQGGQPLMWMTGHSHIKKKMKEIGAAFAGEASGHIFFADRYYGFDDGLYAALRLLELVASLEEPLSTVIDRMPQMHTTPELRIDVAEARKFVVIDEIRARLDADGADYLAIDGVRMMTPDGWWLIRASNTQAAIIARAESTDIQGLARLVRMLKQQLDASGVDSSALDD